jgi:hypothetical protein
MICKTKHLVAALAAAFAGVSIAAVSADEAKQLGGPTLTTFGAEKAGNKEGTIPPYTGEGIKQPAGFGKDPKNPYARPDPLAGEKPLFSITAQNAAQYADKLDGMAEIFKTYPNYRMDVYKTHRSVVFPKYVLDNTVKNATDCKGQDDDTRLDGCWGGLPFPIPKNGAQAMWNHLATFRGHAWEGYSNSYVVAANGTSSNVGGNRLWQQSPFYDPKATSPATGKTVYSQIRIDSDAPSRKAGEKLVIIDPLDSVGVGRRAYQYIPGQRRVKLAPDLAYDTPAPMAGGSATMDDAIAFLGALDRFEFKLVGKKEKFIMYNNFKLNDHANCSDQKILSTKNFPNPDCVRWELHRVWVVEAKLKPGFRHIYSRRMMYWDEDGFSAGVGENYDAANKLYRVVSVISFPYFVEEGGGFFGEGTLNVDLQTGVWSAMGLYGSPGAGVARSQQPKPESFFSPEVMAGEGVR